MKKTKMSLCLTSGFVAAMSLAACSNGVTASDKAIVTIKNHDGKIVDILTDSIYSKYKKENNGVSKYYNAILEALIRYEYAETNQAISHWTKGLKTNSEIKAEAINNVSNDKNTADENANSNGTSYDTEWEKILKSHNCESEAELLEYYIYQIEKEDISDKFFLNEKNETLTKEWLGVNDDGTAPESKVRAAYPYHIRHILASISGGATNFYDGTITSAEAQKLGNIMDALLSDKYTFGQVAQKFPDDAGSAAKGGDAGIMSTSTSFVNEFKLGIYTYDLIYNNSNNAALSHVRDGVGLNADYEFKLKDSTGTLGTTNALSYLGSTLNGGKIQEVPFDAFRLIKDYAEDETDDAGKKVNNGLSRYYPRNVLYNYYLNYHNPFLITNELLSDETGLVSDTFDNARFQALPSDPQGKKYLHSDEGKLIIGCRSEYGIHFMIMEKSILEFTTKTDDPKKPTLEEYYTTLVPSDPDFPKTTGEVKKEKETYVNFIQTSEASTYTTRANEIKNAIKSFDATYDYRLFEYLLEIEGNKITFKDTKLAENIKEYISRTRITNSDSAKKSLNEAWRSYAELLALQYDSRTDYGTNNGLDITSITTNPKSIHPRCAIQFHKGSNKNSGTTADAAYTSAKGACYYEE